MAKKTKAKRGSVSLDLAQEMNRTDGFAREGFHTAVMMRGVGMLPRLRAMSAKERMTVMREASELTFENPVHLYVSDSRFVIVSWDAKPITGAQVIALLVFGMWVHVGENKEAAAGLLVDWPEIPTYVKLYETET